jgi:hypothetical protein
VSVVRGAINDNTLSVTSPAIPGTPPDGGAEKSETATFPARSTQGGGGQLNYLTTPPVCPASGAWVNSVTYYYKDGVTETVGSTSPCTSPAPSAPLATASPSLGQGAGSNDRALPNTAAPQVGAGARSITGPSALGVLLAGALLARRVRRRLNPPLG